MGLLVSYLEALDVVNKVSFDLSLARGLDYYSAFIFEVITKPPSKNGVAVPHKEGMPCPEQRAKSENPSSQVGSIAAGGRYDNLVGMYGKCPIPCVGIWFGVDRRCVRHGVWRQGTSSRTHGGGSPPWNAGIRAEFAAKVKPKLPQQFKAAKDLPLAVILGQDELAAGQVRLKILGAGDDETDTKDRGQLVSREDLVEEVKKLLKVTIYT